MPTIIHGIYDYCLLSGYKLLIIVFVAFIIAMYFISVSKLNDLSSSNKNIKNMSHRYCKYCGAVINQLPICPKCKKKQFVITFDTAGLANVPSQNVPITHHPACYL